MRVGWRRRAAITPKMYTSPQSCLTTGRCTIYNTHERIHTICILIPCLLGSPLPSCSWTSSFSRYCFALSGLFSCTIIASHSNCGRLPLCVCGFFSYCTYILLMDLRSFQRRYLFLSRYSSSQVGERWGKVRVLIPNPRSITFLPHFSLLSRAPVFSIQFVHDVFVLLRLLLPYHTLHARMTHELASRRSPHGKRRDFCLIWSHSLLLVLIVYRSWNYLMRR